MYTTDVPYCNQHHALLTQLLLVLNTMDIIKIHYKFGASNHSFMYYYGHVTANCTRFKWTPIRNGGWCINTGWEEDGQY